MSNSPLFNRATVGTFGIRQGVRGGIIFGVKTFFVRLLLIVVLYYVTLIVFKQIATNVTPDNEAGLILPSLVAAVVETWVLVLAYSFVCGLLGKKRD